MIPLSQVVLGVEESRKGDFGSAVANGVLRYVSVSQATTFSEDQEGGCHRKWFFEKVEHRKPPKTIAQDTGTALHGQIETHLKTGADSLGIIVRAGKHFIPEPKEGLLVEHELGDELVLRPLSSPEKIQLQASPSERVVRLFDEWRKMAAEVDAGGCDGADVAVASEWYKQNLSAALVADGTAIPFVGYIDVVNTRGFWIDDDGSTKLMPANGIEVIDWKTSSNIEKWAKSASALVDTVQLAVYAEYISRRFPKTTQVRLSHGYFQTKGRKASKRSVLVPVDVIRERWQSVSRTVRAMADVAKESDASKVEPNYDSCAVFGGCPHRHLCPRSPEQILVDLFGGKKAMGLMDKFGPPGAPVASPPASPPSPPVTAAPANGASFVDAINNKFGGATATPSVSSNGHANGHTNGLPVSAPVSAPALSPTAACCSEPVTASNVATVGSDTWHMVTSPPHKLIRAVPGAPPPRTNVVFRNGLRIQNREGAQVVVSQDPATGFWFAQTVNSDGSLAPPSPTRPEIWFTDSWTEVAVTTVTTSSFPVAVTTPSPAPANTVVPPDAPPSHPALNALPVPAGTALLGEIAAAVAAHNQEAQAAPAPKGPGGRPKGSKNKKGEEAAASPAQVPMFSDTPTPAATPAATPVTAPVATPVALAPAAVVTTTSDSLTLFIDCVVQLPGVPVTDLEAWVANICATLAQAAGLDDIRIGDADNVLGYGKWKGALAAAVRATPPKGVCSLEVGADEIKQVVAAALKPLATGGYVRAIK